QIIVVSNVIRGYVDDLEAGITVAIDKVEAFVESATVILNKMDADFALVEKYIEKGMSLYDAIVEADLFAALCGSFDNLWMTAQAINDVVADIPDIIDFIVETRDYVMDVKASVEEAIATVNYVFETIDGLRPAVIADVESMIADAVAFAALMDERIADAVEAGKIELSKELMDLKFQVSAYLAAYIIPVIIDIINYDEMDSAYYESDGYVDITDEFGSVDGVIKAILDSDEDVISMIESYNLIFAGVDAGVIKAILLGYLSGADVDFNDLDEINGIDVASLIDTIDSGLVPIIDAILEKYPEYTDVVDIVDTIADLVLYSYLEALDGMDDHVDRITGYNVRATVLLGGAYNIFDGMYVEVDGYVIPVGDIVDIIVSAYNVCIYEFCESASNAVYVGLSDMIDNEPFPFKIDGIDMESIMTVLEGLESVDEDYVAEQIESVLSGMECIPLYDVYWMNGSEILEIDSGLVAEDVEFATYDGATPARAPTYDTKFEFAGWETEVDGNGDVYNHAVFDEIIYLISFDNVVDGEITLDVSNIPEGIETIVIDGDVIDIAFPVELFQGCETVKASMGFVDVADLPSNLQTFAEGKIVLSLELFLDGAKTSDFGGNKVTVSVGYELDAGEDASTLAVWYLNENDMTLEKVDSVYEDGILKITMDHFSYWVIG
ncbi:MAG: hypothetical protein J6R75_03585, partial [Candidatus Methanomethylophilaceae archaeon]|nr:hypothetical protein [Candidatus Methanomethylophilaceae archaeon]